MVSDSVLREAGGTVEPWVPSSALTLDVNPSFPSPGLSFYHCSLNFCHLHIGVVISAVSVFITYYFL